MEGNPEVVLTDFSSIDKGREGTLSFLSNMQYESYLYSTESSAVLVNYDFRPSQEVHTTLIRAPNAYTALADLLRLRNASEPKPMGISPLAYVDRFGCDRRGCLYRSIYLCRAKGCDRG